MFDQFYTTLESLGIVPVVVLDEVEDAAPLAHALMSAGMKSPPRSPSAPPAPRIASRRSMRSCPICCWAPALS